MQQQINVTDNMLVGSTRRLYEQGEITIGQYAQVLRNFTSHQKRNHCPLFNGGLNVHSSSSSGDIFSELGIRRE